jgi:hypothetical protein
VQLVDGATAAQVMLPGWAIAVYEVTGEPPFEVGARQVTVSCLSAADMPVMVGAPGRVRGVAVEEATAMSPLPASLVA